MSALPTRRAVIGTIVTAPLLTACPAPALAAPRDSGGIAWRTAHADCLRKREFFDAMPLGTDGEYEALRAYCDAADHLIEDCSAPDFEAVLTKMDLAIERWEDFPIPDRVLLAVRADIARLAGMTA